MVWRLDKHIAGIGQREKPALAQTLDEVGDNVIVGAGEETERNSFLIKSALKSGHCGADGRTGVQIEPGENMGCARNAHNAIGNEGARHVQRHSDVGSPIVNPWEDVAVKVNHVISRVVSARKACLTEYWFCMHRRHLKGARRRNTGPSGRAWS